ncbi:FtsX-like permease family protein [Micromonospora sp. NPDC047670]|uniref:FtsX-like permease family protein n=1 Tax=Micromonospora sp. NPDC047670 TaxID=3364252 RepID=UPI00371791EA
MRRQSGTLASWRTALRLARRETRRAKGRSALVAALIMLPVTALSFAAVTYDMFRLTPTERAERTLGQADLKLTWMSRNPPGQSELNSVLPAGSRSLPVGQGPTSWKTVSGVGEVETHWLDLTDPLTDGMVELRSGRAPSGETELAASEPALLRLGTTVGGTVTVADGSRRYTVVGVVEIPGNLREVVVLPSAAMPGPASTWLVDTPGPVTLEQVEQLQSGPRPFQATSRALTLDSPPSLREPTRVNADTISAGTLIAGLGALEVVLLAGPAFAIGARRRSRELGLVAANGGNPAHLRRIVLADGVVLGLAGAAAGVALGVTLAVLGRPLVEEHLAHVRAGGHRFHPVALLAVAGLAVLTAMAAALIPAHTAARRSVVAALAGRRGATRSRRRWVVTGVAVTLAGAGLTAYAVPRVSTNLILAGLLLIQVGLVFCTPGVVGQVARVGRHLPPALRIALRDASRNRAAAAPAISAVMAAVAGTVCLGVYVASNDARQAASIVPALPEGTVSVTHDGGSAAPVPLRRITALATTLLSTSTVVEVRGLACPAGTGSPDSCGVTVERPERQLCPYPGGASPDDQRRARNDPRCDRRLPKISGRYLGVLVDDGTALPLLTGARGEDLAKATATLRAGGVVVTDPLDVADGTVTVQTLLPLGPQGKGKGRATPRTALPAYVLTTGLDVPRTILSPAATARVGLDVRQRGFVVSPREVPDIARADAFAAAVQEVSLGLRVEVQRPPQDSSNSLLLVMAVAAGLVTLGATGIATGLTAADSRPDLSTLAAVGASPRIRRVLSLSQSGVIAGLGSLFGLVAGLGSVLAVLAAINQGYARSWPVQDPYPIVVPWSVLGVLVVVPLVAMLGAGLLVRSRLPVERRAG